MAVAESGSHMEILQFDWFISGRINFPHCPLGGEFIITLPTKNKNLKFLTICEMYCEQSDKGKVTM